VKKRVKETETQKFLPVFKALKLQILKDFTFLAIKND